MCKSIALAAVAGIASIVVSTVAHAATTGNWIGPTSSNWSNTAAWQSSIVPNGQGDTAQYTPGSSQIALNDIANVTVGTLKVTGTGTNSMQFTPNQIIIMDQDGAGPGSAQWINDMQLTNPGTNTNAAIFLNAPGTGFSGYFLLQDNLLIKNTSNTTRTTGSIQVRGPIRGTGNITVENDFNNILVGQIAFTNNESSGSGAGGFGGNTTIAKGAVTFSRGDVFTPTPGNFVTIGSTGGGNATLAYVSAGGLGNIENNIVAAANTSGTSVLGTASTVTGLVNIKSTNSYAANVTLNGDLSMSSLGSGTLQIGDPITGVGKLTKIGSGPGRITNANSYSGGTVVDAGSLSVGHTDAINNGFGFYVATDGTLGTHPVRVNSGATDLEIESPLAVVDVINDSTSVYLAGGGGAGAADNGYMLLDAGINETVGQLFLSTDNGVTFVAQPAGTYGPTGSGATNIVDEYFGGSGILTVLHNPGDFNGDNHVDAGDYVSWRKNDGTPEGYSAFRQNFSSPPGSGSGLSSSSVPEPGTLLMALAGVMLTCAGRRRP